MESGVQDIIVINPKGGCGKSTIAMNLAGFFACWGVSVGLLDLDPQQSCLDWLKVRPQALPRIDGWHADMQIPQGEGRIDYRIIDVPSSRFDSEIQALVAQASTVIIPLLPSINDFRATRRFVQELVQMQAQYRLQCNIGFVANRIKNHTKSFGYLKDFVGRTQIPCHGVLRDTQNYIRAAESGRSIFEMPQQMVAGDLKQWQRLIRWLCVDQSVSVRIPLMQDAGTREQMHY